MMYEGIMTPIEILSNSNRLPVINSSIYEPDLASSMIMYSNNMYNYSESIHYFYLTNKQFKYKNESFLELKMPEQKDLLSDPIPVCQFHVIEVIRFFLISFRENEILLRILQCISFTLQLQTYSITLISMKMELFLSLMMIL